MAFVPKSLLRKLYVKGSLKNVDLTGDGSIDGFRFVLKNVLATGTLVAPFELSVDGEPVDAKDVELEYEGEKIALTSISPENPLKFRVGREVALTIKKLGGLSPGEHRIDIVAKTREYGVINFDIKDSVE
ncbi:MAG: hypothetical protein DRJ44_05190 [Thermoprotei archaeon]|nr:MAG: hypothetical protein DRJ44_05190 [Thermoprotei archaeon]